MKHFLIFLFFVQSIFIFGQSTSYGNVEKGVFQSYTAKNGTTYRVGDNIIINKPSSDLGFRWISQGGQRIANTLAGQSVTIYKLKAYGNKRRGHKVYAHFKGYGIVPVLIDLDFAEDEGEIILE